MGREPAHVVVVGAGVGGLTAAALLRRAGRRVTVLEGHVYPGGSAGTFFHKGYRFDAGATLAGGFSPGGPHDRLAEALGLDWPVSPVDPAWVVHLPDGRTVTQWAGRATWRDERQRIFPATERFWRRQERLADLAWDISSRPFPWPPRSAGDLAALALALRPRTLAALPYLGRTVGDLIDTTDPLFCLFLDAQLLISAQTTAAHAGALYGSAALDLPRRGVNHVRGGIGALAQTLVAWLRANGGEVLFRQRVERIEVGRGRAAVVHTRRGLSLAADAVVANVTPWALRDLLGPDAPPALTRELAQRDAARREADANADPTRLPPVWGAFTLYLGLDAAALPPRTADHHQVIVDAAAPPGEGNTVFLSLSPADDPTRAPAGHRAATLSTHTALEAWWRLREREDEAVYLARRDEYASRLLAAAEWAVPGLRAAVRLCLPGTPVTFQFYTGRPRGMVGGFPQSSLFAARGPQTGLPNVWLVGDSIFPGQSTAGVTLGGMRVAAEVVRA
jgi:C-3',4' desaturase CrtD